MKPLSPPSPVKISISELYRGILIKTPSFPEKASRGNSSSSQLFVDRLKPLHVVFSAGYRHHFGHPHRDVLSRYKKSGAKLWNTALDGGITFEWNANGDVVIETARESGAKYWWR